MHLAKLISSWLEHRSTSFEVDEDTPMPGTSAGLVD